MSSPTDRALDDRALVARFLEVRDEASFRVLYCAYTPGLLLFATRLLGRQHDAEDALQETWVRAVRRLDSFRWESSLRTWLSGILVNCCREARRDRRPEEDEAHTLLEIPARPAETLEPPLEALVRRLPDGYREVLVLHDLEGYTHEEISSLLAIAVGTSKSQLSRARQTLRSWLDRGAGVATRRNP